NLPPAKPRQRIVHVFGHRMDSRLVPVREETELVRVSGFICKPEFAKKSRGEQFFFVNQRFIRSPYLHHAVVAAFEGLIKGDVHPGYFLYLEVDPSSLDINIHPTKTEVKFEDEHSLYAILRSTIKHSLGQFNVAPVLDFDHDPNLDTPYAFKQKGVVLPKVTVDVAFNPFKEGGDVRGPVSRPVAGFQGKGAKDWEKLYEVLEEDVDSGDFSSLQIESEQEEQGSLAMDDPGDPSMATTLQLRRKYVVSTIKSGLLVIHQNRAHQRILFEKYLRGITVNQGLSQQLLFPLELEFNNQDLAVLQEISESLTNVGFAFGPLVDGTLQLTGVPMLIPESVIGEVLDRLITDYREYHVPGGISYAELVSKVLAKNRAIRMGEEL